MEMTGCPHQGQTRGMITRFWWYWVSTRRSQRRHSKRLLAVALDRGPPLESENHEDEPKCSSAELKLIGSVKGRVWCPLGHSAPFESKREPHSGQREASRLIQPRCRCPIQWLVCTTHCPAPGARTQARSVAGTRAASRGAGR